MRYRVWALAVVRAELDADCPEDADAIVAHMSADHLEHVEWLGTALEVRTEGKHGLTWEPVPEYSQLELFPGLAEALTK